MKIDLVAKNIVLNKPLREFVAEKISGLDRLLKKHNPEARVEVAKPSKHHRSGEIFYAEINLKFNGKLLRAEAKHIDLHSAITKARDELKIRIKRAKEKGKTLSRRRRK